MIRCAICESNPPWTHNSEDKEESKWMFFYHGATAQARAFAIYLPALPACWPGTEDGHVGAVPPFMSIPRANRRTMNVNTPIMATITTDPADATQMLPPVQSCQIL